jgi:hypothetical protein
VRLHPKKFSRLKYSFGHKPKTGIEHEELPTNIRSFPIKKHNDHNDQIQRRKKLEPKPSLIIDYISHNYFPIMA